MGAIETVRVALCGFEMKIPHSKKKTPAGVTTNFMPTSSNSVTLYNVFFSKKKFQKPLGCMAISKYI
jgi:hypothetical protein